MSRYIIYVIGREVASDEYDWLTRTLGECSVKEVDAVLLTEAERRSLGEVGTGPGAIGCYRAHENIWRMLAALRVDAPESALILEADASVTPFGRRWLAWTMRHFTSRPDMLGLQLSTVRPRATPLTPQNLRDYCVRGLEESGLLGREPKFVRAFLPGTAAYVIKASLAARLVGATDASIMPVDNLFTALSWNTRFGLWRSRQDLWKPDGRPSLVGDLGR